MLEKKLSALPETLILEMGEENPSEESREIARKILKRWAGKDISPETLEAWRSGIKHPLV